MAVSSSSASVANVSGDRHRNSFADVRPTMAKADLKKVDEAEKRRKFGQILARAVQIAGLMNKEVCERLVVDAGQLSRWFAGTENAHVWKFQDDELLGPAFLEAQAEVTPGATIRKVIELTKVVG